MWGPATKSQPYIKRWYGWQTLIAVAGADALILTGAFSDNAWVAMGIGLPIHIMAGPANHWTHGKIGIGCAVFGMNVALPVVGVLTAGVPGAILGLIVPPLLDITLFSTTEDKVRHASARAAGGFLPSSFAIVPMIDANRKGFSIVGQF
jgi:hypothetical protein